jgi:hypothetical protein
MQPSKEFLEGYNSDSSDNLPYSRGSKQGQDWIKGRFQKTREKIKAAGIMDFPIHLIEPVKKGESND